MKRAFYDLDIILGLFVCGTKYEVLFENITSCPHKYVLLYLNYLYKHKTSNNNNTNNNVTTLSWFCMYHVVYKICA
jgi:hypothetical protein